MWSFASWKKQSLTSDTLARTSISAIPLCPYSIDKTESSKLRSEEGARGPAVAQVRGRRVAILWRGKAPQRAVKRRCSHKMPSLSNFTKLLRAPPPRFKHGSQYNSGMSSTKHFCAISDAWAPLRNRRGLRRQQVYGRPGVQVVHP